MSLDSFTYFLVTELQYIYIIVYITSIRSYLFKKVCQYIINTPWSLKSPQHEAQSGRELNMGNDHDNGCQGAAAPGEIAGGEEAGTGRARTRGWAI